jgi:hypothetical protein
MLLPGMSNGFVIQELEERRAKIDKLRILPQMFTHVLSILYLTVV